MNHHSCLIRDSSIFHDKTPLTLDIYIAEVSSAHNVCAKDHYLAIVSTIVETDNPHIEIKPGLDLLGPILDKYPPPPPSYTLISRCRHELIPDL